MVKALHGRRIVIYDETGAAQLAPVLQRRGADVLIAPPLRAMTDIQAFVAHTKVTDFVITPPPSPWVERGKRSKMRLEAALEHDSFWTESLALGLEVPWRWMGLAAEALRGGSVTLLLPRAAPQGEEAPEEATCREGLIAFLRSTAERGPPDVRMNAVDIAHGTPDAVIARFVAGLLSKDGAGVHGQVLYLRAPRQSW